VRLFTTHFSIVIFGRKIMKVKYFPDTDTLLVHFSDKKIVETRDLNENVLVELDQEGRVVSMTIEHAKQQTDVGEFTYQLASA
jgi:uncharacterized protein YuzE